MITSGGHGKAFTFLVLESSFHTEIQDAGLPPSIFEELQWGGLQVA